MPGGVVLATLGGVAPGGVVPGGVVLVGENALVERIHLESNGSSGGPCSGNI